MDPSNFILEYRWSCSTKRKNANVLERFANAIIGWYHQRGSMYAARRDFRLFLCRYIRSNVDEIAGEWIGDNVRNFRSRDHCGTILPPLSFKNLFRLEAKIEEIRITFKRHPTVFASCNFTIFVKNLRSILAVFPSKHDVTTTDNFQ